MDVISRKGQIVHEREKESQEKNLCTDCVLTDTTW